MIAVRLFPSLIFLTLSLASLGCGGGLWFVRGGSGGASDVEEGYVDTTGFDTLRAYACWVLDTDQDGLLDDDELQIYRTDPSRKDTDADGVEDGAEVWEYKTNPILPDTDGDRLGDGEELNETGTDPLLKDTDGDEVPDNLDECPQQLGPPEDNGCPPKPKLGTNLYLPSIFFTEKGRSIVYSSEPNLDVIDSVMRLYPTIAVALVGYTSVGEANTKKGDVTLAWKRVEVVRDELVERGVDPNRLRAHIGGRYGAITSGRTQTERQMNRRVELVIVSDDYPVRGW